MWLPSGKREGTDDADFCMEGIFLGVLIGPKSTTDDSLIGTPAGAYQARAVKRYPEVSGQSHAYSQFKTFLESD